jgi:7,8-dihydropterin-6-yl-methyl-4-(beta-D-ribofuranosyl)aminobenzene 5'-phosphate synthase
MFQLTILSENTVRCAGLLGEHGLAYWLDTGSHRVLFDTGQGMALQPDA